MSCILYEKQVMIQLCAGGICFPGFCGVSTTVHKRFKQNRDALCLGVRALQESESLDKQLTAKLAKAIVENYDRVIDCAENGKPFMASSYGVYNQYESGMRSIMGQPTEVRRE